MNIKSVLRVYSQLRTLTDDETALLETLRKFTDSEREAFVEALQPAKPVVRRRATSKKASKSPRATALESQLKASVDERRQAKATDDCHYVYPADGPVNAGQLCGGSLINRVHDQLAGYVGYHKFEPAAAAHVASGGEWWLTPVTQLPASATCRQRYLCVASTGLRCH